MKLITVILFLLLTSCAVSTDQSLLIRIHQLEMERDTAIAQRNELDRQCRILMEYFGKCIVELKDYENKKI